MPGLQVLACFWLDTRLSCTHSFIAFSAASVPELSCATLFDLFVA